VENEVAMSTPTGDGKKEIITKSNEVEVEIRLFNFDVDGNGLKPLHEEVLKKQVVASLMFNPHARVKQIIGSASESGAEEHNVRLSGQRAFNAREALVKTAGVNPAQVTDQTDGVGSSLATHGSKENPRDRAVILTLSLPLTVEDVSLWTDHFGRELKWEDVIGLDGIENINVQVKVTGVSPLFMPEAIPPAIDVRLTSRPPNKAGGKTTIVSPVSWSVPFAKDATGNHSPLLYRLSNPIGSAGRFLASEAGSILEFATVRREGGTSDGNFREAAGKGGWAFRGSAVQPKVEGTTTGSQLEERPDAKGLLKAGGVEVLDVRVVAHPAWKVSKPTAPPAAHSQPRRRLLLYGTRTPRRQLPGYRTLPKEVRLLGNGQGASRDLEEPVRPGRAYHCRLFGIGHGR
jgi:hypothetical protein